MQPADPMRPLTSIRVAKATPTQPIAIATRFLSRTSLFMTTILQPIIIGAMPIDGCAHSFKKLVTQTPQAHERNAQGDHEVRPRGELPPCGVRAPPGACRLFRGASTMSGEA